MKDVIIYVGMNIQDLKFQCGGDPVGFKNGVVTYSVDSTHRALIETGLHPRKLAENMKKDIEQWINHFDMHFTTHSPIPLDLVCMMINDGIIPRENLKVFVLSDDNMYITHEVTLNEEGFFENWPYGFLDIGTI